MSNKDFFINFENKKNKGADFPIVSSFYSGSAKNRTTDKFTEKPMP